MKQVRSNSIEPQYIKIIRLPEVLERLQVSRTTLYRMMEKGEFPPAISLGARAIGFVSYEVDALIEAMIKDCDRVEIVQQLISKRTKPFSS